MVKLTALPEPAYRRLSDLQSGIDDWYSPNQLQAYGQQCRAEALEEAAKVCDERANGENDAQYCADRIRSMK